MAHVGCPALILQDMLFLCQTINLPKNTQTTIVNQFDVLLVKIEGPGAGIPSIIKQTCCYLLLKGFLQTPLWINQLGMWDIYVNIHNNWWFQHPPEKWWSSSDWIIIPTKMGNQIHVPNSMVTMVIPGSNRWRYVNVPYVWPYFLGIFPEI